MEKRNLMNLYVAASLRSLHTSYAPNTELFQLSYVIPPTFTPLSSIAHLPLYTPSCFLSLDQRPLLLSWNANYRNFLVSAFFSIWFSPNDDISRFFEASNMTQFRTINKGPTNPKKKRGERKVTAAPTLTCFLSWAQLLKTDFFHYQTPNHLLGREFPPSFQLSSWMRSSRLSPQRTSGNPPSVSTKVTSRFRPDTEVVEMW